MQSNTEIFKAELVPHTDPTLRKVLTPVPEGFDVKPYANEMLEICRNKNGVGLAANQLGLDMRLIVLCPTPRMLADSEIKCNGSPLTLVPPLICINPQIVRRGEVCLTLHESCLSFPKLVVKVSRPLSVDFMYTDVEGNIVRFFCANWMARLIQHEMEHLEGGTIIDHVPKDEREQVMKAIEKRLRKA